MIKKMIKEHQEQNGKGCKEQYVVAEAEELNENIHLEINIS